MAQHLGAAWSSADDKASATRLAHPGLIEVRILAVVARLLPILSCLVVLAGACKSDRGPDREPVWSDLEQQSRAYPGPHPTASANTGQAAGGVRVAKPLSVDPLPKACPVSDRSSQLVPGEPVLVSPIRVNFALAKVVKPERAGKVVVASRHGNEFVAAAEHVYPLRSTHRSRAQANCYGACKPVSGWVPCLVTRKLDSQIVAQDRDGRDLNLRSNEVVVFDPKVQDHVREFFLEASYERAFRREVARAGSPVRPRGQQCADGDVVLAAFGDRYLLAQVSKAEADTCTVQWLKSSMRATIRPMEEVLPLPTAYDKPVPLTPGDFVLAHARGRFTAQAIPLRSGTDEIRSKLPDVLWGEWEPMRVEAVYPDGRLLLSDAKQKQQEDATSKVIPYHNGPRRATTPAAASGSAAAAHE